MHWSFNDLSRVRKLLPTGHHSKGPHHGADQILVWRYKFLMSACEFNSNLRVAVQYGVTIQPGVVDRIKMWEFSKCFFLSIRPGLAEILLLTGCYAGVCLEACVAWKWFRTRYFNPELDALGSKKLSMYFSVDYKFYGSCPVVSWIYEEGGWMNFS